MKYFPTFDFLSVMMECNDLMTILYSGEVRFLTQFRDTDLVRLEFLCSVDFFFRVLSLLNNFI